MMVIGGLGTLLKSTFSVNSTVLSSLISATRVTELHRVSDSLGGHIGPLATPSEGVAAFCRVTCNFPRRE